MDTIKVKLIIWDLDETLWDGTLSEGEVTCYNCNYIKDISQHGIINSISSKNDFEKAKAKLLELGIWDYFVFPSINWNPKGEAVKQIIEYCQLRASNVVFVDDNHSNLREVEYYNAGIHTLADIESLKKILNLDDYKEDKALKRLAQYKLLEKKKEYKEKTCTNNQEFLNQSNIKIEFIQDLFPLKERLIEMISRTNQLNYTKIRIELNDLEELLKNSNYKCEAIRVWDKFGDYGICGFYAFNTNSKKLLHFLFSCRILNLGVENYVYQKLEMPLIDIKGDVTTELTSNPVTWITEKKENTLERTTSNNKKVRIALLGGCDLDQLCHYLNNDYYDITKDYNYPNQKCNIVHREHTIYLRKYDNIDEDEFKIISSLPFMDENFLKYELFKEDYDFLVYSPLMNYTQDIYIHKTKHFMISWGGYINVLKEKMFSGFSDSELESFKNDYIYVGQQKEEDFLKDLEWLRKKISKPIIFLNGAEIEHENPNEVGASERHIKMNKVLDEFIDKNNNTCKLIDVRKYVTSRNDLTSNIRHYQREVYVSLAKELTLLTGGKNIVNRAYFSRKFINRVFNIIRNIKNGLF